MKLNNNDDSHNSGLNLLIYNMLLDIESHPTWVCGLKHRKACWESCFCISLSSSVASIAVLGMFVNVIIGCKATKM